MSTPNLPEPGKLIVGMLSVDAELARQAVDLLVEHFGPLEWVSEIFPFTYSNYYAREMGPGVKRRFLSFVELVSPEELVDVKLTTNRFEKGLCRLGRRQVNLDPGLLSLERLVLATGKNATHRIYLGRGIYGDLTLVYRNAAYRTLPWTYPDYREPMVRFYLGVVRARLLHQRSGRLPRRQSTNVEDLT